MSEGGDLVATNVRLKRAVWMKAKIEALRQGKSLGRLIAAALEGMPGVDRAEATGWAEGSARNGGRAKQGRG